MVLGFVRRRNVRMGEALYPGVVAAARAEVFYRSFGVPDTVEGRLELLMLHMALALRRLAAFGDAGRTPSGGLVDAFFADMENTLREFGFGDAALAKRLGDVAGSFYGRLAAYGEALDGEDRAVLAAVLARNVGASAAGVDGAALADHIVVLAGALDRRSLADLLGAGLFGGAMPS